MSIELTRTASNEVADVTGPRILGTGANSAPALLARSSWLGQVPCDVRLDAARRVISQCPSMSPGVSGDRSMSALALELIAGCGLSTDEASAHLESFSAASCGGAWTPSDIKRALQAALRALPKADPEHFAKHLTPYAAEIVAALGVRVEAIRDGIVVRRGEVVRQFAPSRATKAKTLQFENALLRLLPELPSVVVKAAARELRVEPVLAPVTEEVTDVFTIAASRLAETSSEGVAAAAQLLRDPNLLERLVDAVECFGFRCGQQRDLVKAMILGQSVRLAGSSSLTTVRGDPASGKTKLLTATCNLLPPEFVVQATSMTKASLAYMGTNELQYRVLQGGERLRDDGKGNGAATAVQRQMVSDNYYNHLVPVPDGGGHRSLIKRLEGPVAFVESTTSRNVFAEDESRMLSIWLSSTPASRKSVMTSMLEMAKGQHADPDSVRWQELVCHTAFRHLKPYKVVLHSSIDEEALTEPLDINETDVARRFGLLLNLISAHAVLHQFQRSVDERGCLVATVDDADACLRILKAVIGAQDLAQQHDSLKSVAQAHHAFGDRPFAPAMLARVCGTTVHTANRWLSKWKQCGYATCLKLPAGSVAGRYCLTPAAITELSRGSAA